MVSLRAAAAGDAERVAHIYIESWNRGFGHLLGMRDLTPTVVDRWRGDLATGPVTWTVAEVEGSVVGVVGVGPSRDPVDNTVGELNTIAVDPAHWRAGVGSTLMEHAVAQLGDSWSKAVLWTPANYERGHAFYEETGWTPLGWSRREGSEVAFGRNLEAPPRATPPLR